MEMANKTAAALFEPDRRGLSSGEFSPHSTTVIQQQHRQSQHQLGSMTVNFKMSVITSGPHDGLFITTGIQTNNSNGETNGGAMPGGSAWWRSMDQLALQPAREQQPALSSAPTDGMLPPIESLRTVMGERTTKNVVEQTPFPAVEESRSRAVDSLYSRSVSGAEDLYKSAASISEEYFKATTTVASPSRSPQPPPLWPRERSTRIDSVERSPSRRQSPNTRMSGLPLTANGGYSWPQREEKGPKNYGERCVPIKLDTPGRESSTIKLNTFNDPDNSVVASGNGRQVVELKLNPANDYLLNDTTTTTTTLEVFRAGGNDGSNPADYYKLPPEPFNRDFDPSRYIKADGPPYEMSTRTETRFSDQARQSAEASFATSPTQQYYVTEPTSTPMNGPVRWVRPEAARPPSGDQDQSRPESRLLSSTSPLSSNWNVEQQPPAVLNGPSTTILRRQRNEHRDRRIVPRQIVDGMERTCPPVPPKPLAYHQLRRGVSQPELLTHNFRGVSGARMVPPRPTTRKPQLHAPPSHAHRSRSAGGGEHDGGGGRARSASNQPVSYLQPEQLRRYLESTQEVAAGRRAERPRSAVAYYPPALEAQPMGVRSASVNEIFKLYQTRDCLGRVVRQLQLRALLLSRRFEEESGLLPPLRLNPISTPRREEGWGEESELEEDCMNCISVDELFSLKELDALGDSMNSTSSSSFANDFSPRAEWERSRFIEPLEGADVGIGLTVPKAVDEISNTATTTTTTTDVPSVDELKGLIARHVPLAENPLSPHSLRLPQLERTLSTLDEMSEGGGGSFAQSPTSSQSTTTNHSFDRKGGNAGVWTPKTTFAAATATTADDRMSELASRAEQLEPRELLSKLFSPPPGPRPSDDDAKKVWVGSSLLLPPLPKRPAPPSAQRSRGERRMSARSMEEEGALRFVTLEAEPRRAGMSAARRANDAVAHPNFRLIADGFQLRIVDD